MERERERAIQRNHIVKIQNKLSAIFQEIESRLDSIQKEFKTAIAEKTKLEFEAEKTALTISLAHRLVNGLGSEAIRWHQSVEK